MSSLNGAVTAHYLVHWRVPQAFHRQTRSPYDDGDLAILEYAPRPTRPYYVFATNGMSARVHERGGKAWRKELYIYLRARQAWAVPLLAALARYPAQQHVALSTFDTIPVAASLTAQGLPFPAVMLADPQHGEPTVGLVAAESPEPVLCDQVVGLCESELRFAEARSAVELWRVLKDVDGAAFLDQARPAVV